MSIENINQAAEAMNALTARMNAFVQEAKDEINVRRDAYDDLANDLVEVVKKQMSLSYFVSPNGSNLNNGLSREAPLATLGRVFEIAPKASTVNVYIESSEADPFEITISDVDDRKLTLRPFNNGEIAYLKWRGVINVSTGTVDFIYNFEIDYDANEYDGYLFNAGQMASVSVGGFNTTNIKLKNTTDFRFVNSVYTRGGFVSVYLARTNLLDDLGDPYAGDTTIFHRGSGSGFAAYELWQCNLGPNFVHAGTAMGGSSYIMG